MHPPAWSVTVRDIAWYTWPAWLAAVMFSMLAGVLVVAVETPASAEGSSQARHALRPSPLSPHDYDHLLQQAAVRHLPVDVDWRLLKAIVWKESTFNPRARSPAGAMGLMQLMPGTARHLGLRGDEVFDPARNIDAGARYVAEMLGYWRQVSDPERMRLAMASYNWGIGNVRRSVRESGASTPRWSAVRPKAPTETRDYVYRVLEQRLRQEQAQDHRPGQGPQRPALPLPKQFARPW